MQRPTIWLMLVVLLLGVLFLREPRLEPARIDGAADGGGDRP